MFKILVIHGPNLNLLGLREPEIYGQTTLEEINRQLEAAGLEMGLEVRTFQSNHEGALIDQLHQSRAWADGVIINPGGYTHTSVALHDAIAAIQIPVVEAHLSNIHSREEYRRHSITAAACKGIVAGFGWRSYLVALSAIKSLLAA